jgi:Lar family restriction alleviation protein
MSDALKPCPFCGRRDTRLHRYTEFRTLEFDVVCFDCRANGPIAATANGAIAAWNLSWTLAPLSDAILDCQSDERERICCELLNLGTTKRARVTLAAAVGAIRSRARKIEERLPEKKPTKTEVPK